MIRWKHVGFNILLILWIFTANLNGQAIAREKYIKYIPIEYPKMDEQTEASKKFALYGDIHDPDYRDIAPVDGMDDERSAILHNLAVHFAPIIVQNTVQMPAKTTHYLLHVS